MRMIYTSIQSRCNKTACSFGVVLLELVMGQKAVDVIAPRQRTSSSSRTDVVVAGSQFRGNLAEYVNGLASEGKAGDAADPSVKDTVADEEIRQVLKVAVSCVSGEPKERPSMFEVYQLLRAIGQKYNYTIPYNDLPSVYEDEVHVDVHEAIHIKVHMDSP